MPHETFHSPPHALCPHCGMVLQLGPLPWAYFEGELPPCPKCSVGIDLHEVVLAALVTPGFDFLALAALGAQATHLLFTLEPEQAVIVRFVEHEIPADARIIGVNYTPQGKPEAMLFPLEIHGNRPARYMEPNERHLFPMPFGKGPSKPTLVGMSITWVPNPKAEGVSWDLLVEAFHRFQVGHLASAVIAANTAVEILSGRVLSARVRTIANEEKTRSLIRNAGTSGHRINILFPLLARSKGLPWLRKNIHARLCRLNFMRNKVAHEGASENLARTEVAEGLAAALFAIRYLQLVESKLMDDPSQK